MSIIIENLTKMYGSQKALDNVSMTIESGQITGLLGPNGAGKSTLMKIITGSIIPEEGNVLVNGIDVLKEPLRVQRTLGYLPEHNPQYLEMYVQEYLAYVAAIYKVGKSRIATVIDMVLLGEEKHKKIGALSKGYRQRVGLAAALIPDPEVLILDEPTTGLDPSQLQEIRGLLKDVAQHKTVLFSTHIMQEVVEICSECVLLSKGKIKKQLTRNEIERGPSALDDQFSSLIA